MRLPKIIRRLPNQPLTNRLFAIALKKVSVTAGTMPCRYILKKSVRKEQPDKIPFSIWIPKLIDLLKRKFSLIDYLYIHVCDYNTNRLKIEANTERILKRQNEILARVNELRCPLTIIPPNVNGLFLRGYHFKLRYVIIVVIAILSWAVAASESFAHYSMYRAVKEQHQHLIKITCTKSKLDTE